MTGILWFFNDSCAHTWIDKLREIYSRIRTWVSHELFLVCLQGATCRARFICSVSIPNQWWNYGYSSVIWMEICHFIETLFNSLPKRRKIGLRFFGEAKPNPDSRKIHFMCFFDEDFSSSDIKTPSNHSRTTHYQTRSFHETNWSPEISIADRTSLVQELQKNIRCIFPNPW